MNSNIKNPHSRPNILWISLEDTSPRFGCYGDQVAETPNIDTLATEGRLYKKAFSVAGVCSPSRSAIITGMYPITTGAHHHRVTHDNDYTTGLPTPYEVVLPPSAKLVPEYLRQAGYYCTNNQKTDYQFSPPFTAWDECDEKAHWRNRPNSEQPFFAVFNPIITHESYMWEKEGETIQTDPEAIEVPPYLPDTLKSRKAIARQYDNIAKSDEIVGQLLKELEEDGLSENTLVILWSDHGEGLPRSKRWPYDGGIRIPLIVRFPQKVDPGEVSDELISLIDLGPTILETAGLEKPIHMQGRSFLNPQNSPREYIYASRDRHDESYDCVRAVRDNRYKFIQNYFPEQPYLSWVPYREKHPIMQEMRRLHNTGELNETQELLFQNNRPVEELYDTRNDPWEINNLAEDPNFEAEKTRLRNELHSWQSLARDKGHLSENEMVESFWPNKVQPETAKPWVIGFAQNSPTSAIHPIQTESKLPAQHHIECCCNTQGASIGYTLESGENATWQLYTGPIRLQPGKVNLRVKAIRVGYKTSPERAVTLHISK